MFSRKKTLIFAAAGLLLLILVSLLVFHVDNYYMTVINVILIYFFCTIGIMVLLGLCGQLSFASISFMGAGAFLTAQLAKNYGFPPLLALICGVLLAGVFSLAIGALLLRLQGSFFIFGTIGFVQMMQTIYQNYQPLSGGPNGIYGIPKLSVLGFRFDSMTKWFFLLLALAVIVALLVQRLRSSALGRSMMAVRDNELAAQSLGVNVYIVKLKAFTISGTIAALGGGLLAFHNGVVSSSLFTFNVQLQFLMMATLGGINSVWGTALGTVLVSLLPELMRPLLRYMQLIYGGSIILLMIFMPTGIAGCIKSVAKRLRAGRKGGRKHADSGGS